MVVSLHNSGSLVPLVASELSLADSTSLAPLGSLAGAAGLKTAAQDGLFLASTSETLLNAARRALDEGICILEAPGLPELTGRIGGSAVAFLSARQTPKILQVWSTARIRRYAVLRPARAATGSKEARVAESAKAISEATSGTSEPLLCSETAIREAPALDR